MEKESVPLILSIKGNSLDDGPGIRSVVFFKGCPLSCVWCHNPESKKAGQEIAFDAKKCVDCGACREICPEKALSKSHAHYIDRKRCNLCFQCVEVCPSGALEQVGKPMTVDAVVAAIEPDIPFFKTSGGGVTLSGGEATLFMSFVSRLLRKLKSMGVHTLIETCGQFEPDRFMDLIYPHVDAIYYDIKLLDSDAHKSFCGVPNQTILSNFRRLVTLTRKDGKTLLPRTPLIPGITDTEDNIRAISLFLTDLGIRQASLLPYNPLWQDKTTNIGAPDPLKDRQGMRSFLDKDVVSRCNALFAGAGIET